jgi:hypothetical protein
MSQYWGEDRRGFGRPGSGRGQSETLGFVLVFALMLVGALIVVALGATALNGTEDQVSDQRAEKAMTQFDSKAGLVALEEADSQRVSFATDAGEQFQVQENRGWMNVTYQNQTSGYRQEVLNETLGAVVYRRGDTRLAYQGGGVFQVTENGGRMVSPPEFHYRGGTLTLPTVVVEGEGTLGGSATVRQGDVERHFPTTETNLTNPLDNHLVTVTVRTEYYMGWGQYFEERTDGEVEYNHEKETARLLLVSPIEMTEITAASASLAASGEFNVSGNSALSCGAVSGSDDNIFTDSYNSSGTDETYCEQLSSGKTGTGGDLRYAGDVNFESGAGGSGFCGDIVSGGTVFTRGGDSSGVSGCGDGTSGQPMIFGNVNYTDSCHDCDDAIVNGTGETERIDGVRRASAINWFVNNTISEIENNADEVNPTLTDGTTLDQSTYYFDSLSVGSDDEIELDTDGNNIEIAVREDVDLAKEAVLNVTGDGNVRMYVSGENVGSGDHLTMDDDAAITNADDNATQFRTYGRADFQATIGGGGSGSLAKYVGVLYAPPGANGDGTTVLDGGEVFGGMLTGTTILEGGSIHYDEALKEKQIIPPDANQIRVTFLHVTTNRITVESG